MRAFLDHMIPTDGKNGRKRTITAAKKKIEIESILATRITDEPGQDDAEVPGPKTRRQTDLKLKYNRQTP